MSSGSLPHEKLITRHFSSLRLLFVVSLCVCVSDLTDAQSQNPPNPAPPPTSSLDSVDIPSPANAPAWFTPAYLHARSSPLPPLIDPQTTRTVIGQFELFHDGGGALGNYQPGGPTTTGNNAFFQSLGTNGRSCVTCHQPSSALSVSTEYIRAVFAATAGRDPLFAPVDGANCPSQVPAVSTSVALLGGRVGSATLTDLEAAHSLLLNKGLFRIFLPVPKQTIGRRPHATEYALEVVSDPNGCNTDPAYNQVVDPATGEITQIVSVYRRPLIASNLKFKTTTLADFPGSGVPPIDLLTGVPLPIDLFTGLFESINIMWDGREPTLESQANDATLIHSQATTAPTNDQIAQMVAFENGIFSAQERLGPVILSQEANGGAKYLSAQSPSMSGSASSPTPPFDEFDAWNGISPNTAAQELQASIARGQTIFNTFPFNFQIGGFVGKNCATCHTQNAAGAANIPGSQVNTGVGGQSVQSNGPAPDSSLPIFKLTCAPGAVVGSDGPVVTTNDPGLALITGRCVDIGTFTVPTIRGLAARAPYFHNGSARRVLDVVNFYDQRFSIGFTDSQKRDLVNFLRAL
jgi:cytochrome c peroxidase